MELGLCVVGSANYFLGSIAMAQMTRGRKIHLFRASTRLIFAII